MADSSEVREGGELRSRPFPLQTSTYSFRHPLESVECHAFLGHGEKVH
jgi:hypothetical protein